MVIIMGPYHYVIKNGVKGLDDWLKAGNLMCN